MGIKIPIQIYEWGAKKHSFRIRTLPSVREFHPVGLARKIYSEASFADFHCRYGIAKKAHQTPKNLSNIKLSLKIKEERRFFKASVYGFNFKLQPSTFRLQLSTFNPNSTSSLFTLTYDLKVPDARMSIGQLILA